MIWFDKVPFNQFKEDVEKLGMSVWTAEEIDSLEKIYESIKLPRRATPDSAGYDFYLPFNVCFSPDSPAVIPTGVRVFMPQDYFLMCVPRSGLGFKYGVGLRNTLGIIDSGYSGSSNFGHIMASITTDEPVSLKQGDRFMQGIFLRYGLTSDDSPIMTSRDGGFGSTGGAV